MADTTIAPVGLPLNMAPAPAIEQVLTPIDLADCGMPQYAGWVVVPDPEAPIGANTLAAIMADKDAPVPQRLSAMEKWVASVLLYWNFTYVDPESGQRVPMPQPRDGGAKYCPQILFKAIAQAHAQVTSVPND